MIFGIFGGKTVADVKKVADKVAQTQQRYDAKIDEAQAAVARLRFDCAKQVLGQAEGFEAVKETALADRYAALKQIQNEIEQLASLSV